MKHILSKEFIYVPAARTDIRETFARVIKERAEEEKKRREAEYRTNNILRMKK